MAKTILPNLIIAGVGKAATTSLFAYLSAHPDICPARVKEGRILRAAATRAHRACAAGELWPLF